MKPILTIFKKELKDVTRDRRSMMMMIVLPMLLFPVLITLVGGLTMRQAKKAKSKTLEVALIAHGNATAFRDTLLERGDLKIREDVREDRIRALIQSDSLDAAIRFDAQFDAQIDALQSGRIHLYFNSSKNLNESRTRLTNLIRYYENQLVDERFQRLSLDRKIVDPVQVQRHDIASAREKVGMVIGGFLPYIFILMGFLGCMYPAIDLGAGEKERGTLETLLVVPVSRFHILLGKCAVVMLAGLVSVLVSFVGLFFIFLQSREIVSRILQALQGTFDLASVLLFFSLFLPLVIFFATALMSLSIFARSFKEAQTIMTPLNIVIIVPAAVGLLPGIELDAVTAFIPILNISLAAKDILSGTISIPLLLEVYASLIALAGLSLYGCAKWFERESTIFRET